MDSIDDRVIDALTLCGFIKGQRQESRLMSLLVAILKLQSDPPIPLEFGEIYNQLMLDNPTLTLSKQWVSRVLKQLVDTQLVRLENPKSRNRRYIADVNTIMAGFERMKSMRMEEIKSEMRALEKDMQKVNSLDCGDLAKDLVEGFIGKEQKISSRVVRGVEELHRVLRYNMLDIAKKGDILRATVLWVGPFMDNTVRDRTLRFLEAAKRGAEIRYFVTTDLFNIDDELTSKVDIKPLMIFMQNVFKLREAGIKFHVRLYAGKRTYNQISFNRESTALIIAENPVTATWVTRDFNSDLIDNAVDAFDREWSKGKSVFDLTRDDLEAFGVSPEGPISKILISAREQSQ